MRIRKLARNNSGQALVETAIILPFLLAIILNAVNFAFFFLMALNITASSRSSGLYSILGNASTAARALPLAGPYTTTTSVSYIAFQDMTGAVYTPSTSNTGVQVCSPSVGILNAGTGNQKSDCTNVGIGSFPAAGPDPECGAASTSQNPPCTGGTPAFLLNRVDVAYKFTPPIALTPFNIFVWASPFCTSTSGTVSCTFYRHTEMRAMN
jgi:Flp pilus assembly protein TadG